MKSLWSNDGAKKLGKGLLSQRVYTSRLLGANPSLVLHGGGNTSVKVSRKDFFGSQTDILYVKGSGHDLASIDESGFSPCRMDVLLKLAEMDHLTDSDMVAQCSAAMLGCDFPRPSIEALVHAVIPHRFVDHTHADAVVALTNSPGAKDRLEEIYGDKVLVVPYVMPGFELAREIKKRIDGADLSKLEGMILMNHGVFTFHDDARKSYQLMIKLSGLAENYIKKLQGKSRKRARVNYKENLPMLSALRRSVSGFRKSPVYAVINQTDEAVEFSRIKGIASLVRRGPLTPDHVIRTKRIPAVIGDNVEQSVALFAKQYAGYFNRHGNDSLTMLDPAPRWAVWPDHGIISFGTTMSDAGVISDIATHTARAIQQSEGHLGGWRPLSAAKLFEIEYWELEQAKLRTVDAGAAPHQGKIAVVSGSAAGIG